MCQSRLLRRLALYRRVSREQSAQLAPKPEAEKK